MMQRRVPLALLVVGGIVTLVVLVGQAGAAQTSPTLKSLPLKFPIPAANTAAIEVATIKAKAPTGKTLGAATMHTTSDPHLQNESIVYLIKRPSKRVASATYKVYALIEYTSQTRKVQTVAAAAGGALDATVTFDGAVYLGTGSVSLAHGEYDCSDAQLFDRLFESGATQVNDVGETFSLESALPTSEQGSPPEEVLDTLIANYWKQLQCSGWKPEGDDPGAK